MALPRFQIRDLPRENGKNWLLSIRSRSNTSGRGTIIQHPSYLGSWAMTRNMMFDGNRAFGRFHNILARQLEMKSLSPGALQIPSTYKASSLVSPLTLEGMCQCDPCHCYRHANHCGRLCICRWDRQTISIHSANHG
ncbi:hypothetical protein M378DRAFT_465590 [Amanita muscaria Koide BX008]|uniref:Uncharacterized protein n=1 Tax=Amanita muscaria (strain Koide BX008) TaxID=946122 RepID=A0A0C2SRF4_AMAMK|nr:hypothetical protein M378DRAFT_465590 [Amanita muscaria Koide BX008]